MIDIQHKDAPFKQKENPKFSRTRYFLISDNTVTMLLRVFIRYIFRCNEMHTNQAILAIKEQPNFLDL